MPKKVSKRSPASKSKVKPPVQTARKRRAPQKGGSNLNDPPELDAAAIQRLRELAPLTNPFALENDSAPSEAMLYQSALAKALRARASPEQEASRRKYWADLKAEEARRISQELEKVVSQFSPETKHLFDSMWETRSPNDAERLREAKIFLGTQGFSWAPRLQMLVGLLETDEEERMAALRQLAGRYNAGQSRDDARWARAKQAWLEAHRRGRPNRAIPDAMEAGGFKKSAVYQRAKQENWHAERNR